MHISREEKEVARMKADLLQRQQARQDQFELMYPLYIGDQPIEKMKLGYADETWPEYFSHDEFDVIYNNFESQAALANEHGSTSLLMTYGSKEVGLALLSTDQTYHYFAYKHLKKLQAADLKRSKRVS